MAVDKELARLFIEERMLAGRDVRVGRPGRPHVARVGLHKGRLGEA